MSLDNAAFSLAGQLLVALPVVTDVAFRKGLVFVCAHSTAGAMGLVVNRPAPDSTLRRLLRELQIDPVSIPMGTRIYAGGPAEPDRGFVLHSPEYHEGQNTLRICKMFSMTATQTVLEALAIGGGPASSMVAMGYSGWGPGQLEGEIRENCWLTTDPDPDLLFGRNDAEKWDRAVTGMGISPAGLSGFGGQA
ncbi:MAG: YqgE/AlgH family protein [Pseudomonadota bacterium]